jgi:hypothetical protein
MSYVEFGCRAALAFVFFVACTSKIHSRRSYREFRDSLTDLGLPSAGLLRALSLGIPAAEGGTVILLAINRASWWGLIAAAALVGSFAAGIAVAGARGRVVRCRCFGDSRAPSSSPHLLRNVVLLAAAAAGVLAGLAPGGPARAPAVVFAVGLGLIAAALFLRWDELAFLFTPAPGRRGGKLRSTS